MKPIAIIGMSSIFPQAKNIVQYWDNILGEINCISEVPPSRWKIDDYYDPDPSTPDKTYCKYGGFIPDIKFDPMEFGLPPNILEVTDVSQLLSLIVTRDALTDAGYIKADKALLDRTGVILGMVGMSSNVIQPLLSRLQYPIWEKVLINSGINKQDTQKIVEKMKLAYISWNENAFPGAIGNVIAGRIANRFDLGGTNCVIDAACASSLSAVKMAISELLEGHADMMITGGVDTDNSILAYMCFSKTPAFSKGDQLRAFGSDSDGMLVGEGIGMLILKRLEDAEKDNDRIYAVIKGVGSSSDGRFKSIYAPRSGGQAKALRRAYKEAGFSPDTVGLIEAHGTGTIAGDPAEFEGLREIFDSEDSARQTIALGSVKSQIGHTKAAAGAASLIKAALALHHKILPATINVSKPNPQFEIENTPFYLNTETRPWMRKASNVPRRAGVSSFGFGGTNFHIVLEEYQDDHEKSYRLQSTPTTVLLFASNTDQLLENCEVLLSKLDRSDGQHHLNEQHISSQTASIPNETARLGFISRSLEEAQEFLQITIDFLKQKPQNEEWNNPKGIFYRKSGMDPKGKTVALFPGQGSQYVNMGKELATNFPPFRKTFEKANEMISNDGREPLTNIVYPIPVFSEDERKNQLNRLTKTETAQPAIGTFSVGAYKLLDDAGFQPDFFAGHSFGELTALWASGVFGEEAFTRLAKARGEAMSLPVSSKKDTGSMIAVKGNVEKVQSLLKDNKEVTIANFNSPSQVVLAGSTKAVQSIRPKLEQLKLKVYPLQVSAAFHTSFVKHAQAPFKLAIQKENFQEPNSVIYSNSTAHEYDKDPQKISQILAEHILNPVHFREEIENIYADGGSIFIEIGPKNILTNLVKDILKDKPHETITLNANAKGNSDLQFRQAVLQMRVLGFELGDIDPYRKIRMYSQPTNSKVTVSLNGGLYTSEETLSKFEKALQEKPQKPLGTFSSEQTNKQAVPENAKITTPVKNNQDKSAGLSNNGKTRSSSSLEVPQMSNNHQHIESLIERFQEHQNGFLKAHEQFLENDKASKKIIQEITQAELSIISKVHSNSMQTNEDRALSIIEKRAGFVTNQHAGTAEAHMEYIKSHTTISQQYAALIKELINSAEGNNDYREEKFNFLEESPQLEVSSPAVEVPFKEFSYPVKEIHSSQTDSSTAGYDVNQLTQSFIQIVSEKTGYPTDMLELKMDLEADLGIDSIKRVEILGAMQEQFPDLPTIEAEDLAVLRTLEQIVGALNNTPHKITQKEPVKQEYSSDANAVNVDDGKKVPLLESDIQDAFLEIVSEKTGYPTDMLEIGMDMEADLGIDSIKRVEILGAMQEKFPQLPAIEAEELAILRTLEQIIDKFNTETIITDAVETVASPSVIEEHPQTGPTSIERFSVNVKQLPQPDFLKFDLPEDSLILITDDGTQKSQLLAEFYLKQNLKVGMIHFGKASNKEAENLKGGMLHFHLAKANEDEIHSKMKEIIGKHKKISAFIHMNPPSKGNNKDILDVSEKEAEILKSVFLMARHLKKPLTAAGKNNRSAFLTVSQMDGQFGLNGNSSNNPIPGGLSGLTKTLRLEWKNVFCRALDLHPDIDPHDAVKRINDELHDPNLQLTEVGYSQEGRYTLSLENES